jgi:hypothetical protein
VTRMPNAKMKRQKKDIVLLRGSWWFGCDDDAISISARTLLPGQEEPGGWSTARLGETCLRLKTAHRAILLGSLRSTSLMVLLTAAVAVRGDAGCWPVTQTSVPATATNADNEVPRVPLRSCSTWGNVALSGLSTLRQRGHCYVTGNSDRPMPPRSTLVLCSRRKEARGRDMRLAKSTMHHRGVTQLHRTDSSVAPSRWGG